MIAKKGQTGVGAAILLALIMGLLILFVVMIPPQDRADILDGDGTGSSETTTPTNKDIEKALPERVALRESPGRIDFLSQNQIEHPLPVVNVFTKTEGKVLASSNVAYAKKGVFSAKSSTFRFTIPDIHNTDQVLLSYGVDVVSDRMIILLNSVEIFNGASQAGIAAPITLPKNLLKSDNVLEFKASSPGVAFWATNEVSLQNIKISGEVTSVESQSSRNIFLVSETEKKNLKRVTLKFNPTCELGDVGKLRVTINGREVYNSIPDCDLALIPIEFSPDTLNQGENEIRFFTTRGNYLLSHIVVKSSLHELEYPTYYFELSLEEFKEINKKKKRLRVSVDFVDVITRKFGKVIFNGNTRHFDTKEVSYTLDVSDDVVRGNNAIKIVPSKTLDVRELKVELVK